MLLEAAYFSVNQRRYYVQFCFDPTDAVGWICGVYTYHILLSKLRWRGVQILCGTSRPFISVLDTRFRTDGSLDPRSDSPSSKGDSPSPWVGPLVPPSLGVRMRNSCRRLSRPSRSCASALPVPVWSLVSSRGVPAARRVVDFWVFPPAVARGACPASSWVPVLPFGSTGRPPEIFYF